MRRIALGPQEQIAADRFRGFYAGLLALRDTITPPPPADGAAPAAPAHQPPIEDVRALLTQAIVDFGYRPAAIPDAPVDPGYVMAAVADEVVLTQCQGWAAYEAWADRPLESILYGSSLAGDRVFAAADALVTRRREEPQTATVILLALLTGFRGRYQNRDDRGRISALEAQLYTLVCDRPYDAGDTAPYAAPAAMTLYGESVRPLPALWPWLVTLALLLLAYLPASHMLWWYEVQGVVKLAQQILANSPASPPGSGTR